MKQQKISFNPLNANDDITHPKHQNKVRCTKEYKKNIRNNISKNFIRTLIITI